MSEQTPTLKKHGVRMSLSWEQLLRERAKGHTVYTPKSRFWLWRRHVFAKFWNWLVEYGHKRDFFEREACYECGGELVPTIHAWDAKWVSDE